MTVEVVEGDVVITGPDGIGMSMTGAAAGESARRLHNASRQVARQISAPSVDDGRVVAFDGSKPRTRA